MQAGKGAQANGSASKGAAAGGKGGKGTAAAAGTSEDDGGDEAGPETDGRASGSGEEVGVLGVSRWGQFSREAIAHRRQPCLCRV